MNTNKKKSNNSLEKLATLADVAEQAQVSTATVSRCLNSPERVDPNTREREYSKPPAMGGKEKSGDGKGGKDHS